MFDSENTGRNSAVCLMQEVLRKYNDSSGLVSYESIKKGSNKTGDCGLQGPVSLMTF